MDRVRRTALAAAMICACMAVIASGAIAKPAGKANTASGKSARSGRLDRSFGEGGKVTAAFPAGNTGSTAPKYTLPFEFTPGHLEMAPAPGGKVVVAGATKVVRYLADGKPDPSFGNGGTANVPNPPGYAFVLAGVAVDSQGRVVLAGLARPLPASSAPDPLLSSAVVMRLNADGTPDSGFGNGGTVLTDFGLGAPKAPGGPYLGASVGLRDVVIGPNDLPVVSGAYVTEVGTSRGSAESEGFVARLTETGALDQSFGEKGLRKIASISSFGQLVSRPVGFLALGEQSQQPYLQLTGFAAGGNLDTGFGSFGFRALAGEAAPTLAVAPSGKVLLLGPPRWHHVYRPKKVKDAETGKIVTKKVRTWIGEQTVQRLLPSGAGDPSFGRSGAVTYNDPKPGSYTAIAVDAKERIYLAGRIGKHAGSSRKGQQRTNFLLARTKPNGSPDRSFGHAATVSTDFGARANAFATQVMLDPKGRILVGGGIESPQLESGGGFAIARYLP
ncbi:MAG: hypothetical protein JSU06_08445 [Actinobacteria bacterium]|nr:hypothetical protein [Actinomycetota bacterium]